MPDNDGVKIKEAVDPATQDDSDGDVVVMGSDGKPDDGSGKAMQRERSEDTISHDSIGGETSRIPPPPIETIITASEDVPEPSPIIRVIPPAALALQVQPRAGPAAARKSPVTVQEWVDSLPPPRLRADNTPEQWPTPRPEGLKREASVQSDAGSHCSSVESLLGSRRPDPEEILIGLGFGGTHNDLDSDVARIPRRFLKPSKVKGVAIDDFLKHQHDLVQTFESGFFGYRGLTGPGYRTPSVIVAKIMEKLRVGKSGPASPPAAPGKRFSRAARKVMNVSSVLTPDNRMFLDSQGGKSPEVPRKRMIIGHRSFTFDQEGHLIELRKSPVPSCDDSDAGSPLLVKSDSPTSSDDIEEVNFVPDMSSTARSFSEDSTEADSSVAMPLPPMFLSARSASVDSSVAPAPAFSTSSRSASVDSIETSSLPQLNWELPRLSSWDSSSKVDFPRSFSRYESIEETSERGSEPADEPISAVQQRRGSLKRQQHVDEDNVKLEADLCLQTLPKAEMMKLDSVEEEMIKPRDALSLQTLPETEVLSIYIVKKNGTKPEHNASLATLPERDAMNQVPTDEIIELKEASDLQTLPAAVLATSSILEEEQVPSLHTLPDILSLCETLSVNEEPVSTDSSRTEELLNPGLNEEDMESIVGSVLPRQEVVEPLCMRQMRGAGAMAPLLRVRSDSSGFLDQDIGDCSALEEARNDRQDLDQLVHELKRRGLQTTNCRDTAVRLAVSSYGGQLRREVSLDSDLVEARSDIEALRRLRELVAIELRRVADLLDEQPGGTGLPTITSQMTALLRQQTRLRRQLESLSDETVILDDSEPPSCCEVLSLVQDGHRHLECLIEQNSRELVDIRKLLSDLVAARR